MLELYRNIRKYRKEAGMSQEELAKKVGYNDRSSIAKIENGDVDLPQSKIMSIAKALGVDAGTLMGWEDSREDVFVTKGQRIRELLDRSGMSRTDFAAKIGASKQTVYKYEHDIVTNIPSDMIRNICRVFNVSPGYLMGIEDNPAGTAASMSFSDPKKNWLNHLYDELDPKYKEALLTRADELYKLQQLDRHEVDVERRSFTVSDSEDIA